MFRKEIYMIRLLGLIPAIIILVYLMGYDKDWDEFDLAKFLANMFWLIAAVGILWAFGVI
jgi:hypothetical protein